MVLAGHEHFYERLRPQKGISYFVLGSSGEFRDHNLRPSADVAKGFDTDQVFSLMEIAGAELNFQVVSRTGETVDEGVVVKPRNRKGT